MSSVLTSSLMNSRYGLRTSSMTRLILIMPSYRMAQGVIRLSHPSSLQDPVLRKSQ